MVKEKTIRELVNRVARESGHLLDMNDDAVVVYQDLIGHATTEENQELANDPALNETFYRIYGVAYGTTASIKFYLNNSDKVAELQYQREEYKAAFEDKCKELETANERIKAREKEVDKLCENIEELKGRLAETKRDMEGTLKVLNDKDRLIMALKAKLYDMMQK